MLWRIPTWYRRLSFHRRRLFRRLVKRRAEHHVLDGQGYDRHVVRFHACGAKHESVRVDQPGCQPHRGDVNVEIDQRQEHVFCLFVEVQEADFPVLLGQCGVFEVVESRHGVAGRGFRDDDGAFEARREVIENAAQRVGVRGRQLVVGGDVVGLDDNVLLPFQLRLDLLVDRHQGFINVLAPVVTVDQRDGGPRGQRRERIGVTRRQPAAVARRLRCLNPGQLLFGGGMAAPKHGSCRCSCQMK